MVNAVILKLLRLATCSVVKATIWLTPNAANCTVLMARRLVLVSTSTSRASKAATCSVRRAVMLRVLKSLV